MGLLLEGVWARFVLVLGFWICVCAFFFFSVVLLGVIRSITILALSLIAVEGESCIFELDLKFDDLSEDVCASRKLIGKFSVSGSC